MKDTRFAKSLVFMNGLVPVLLLAWDASDRKLGADPVNFAIHTTGKMSLIFLVLTLLVSPVRQWTGWNWLLPLRRGLGLYAMFYAAIHLAIFFGFDRAMSVSSTLEEIIKRQYLWFGTASLVAMAPLAVTSTDRMIRWLGANRWKALHRLTYVAALAGGIHYYMLVKRDTRQPIAFLVVIDALLLYRLIANEITVRRGYRALRAAAPANAALIKPKFWRGQLRVARVFQETPEVRTIRLAPLLGTVLPFDYLPGQYLNLMLDVDGKKVKRSYTIASSPSQTAYCELTVKREALGVSSRHLHEKIMPGDVIEVAGPAGRFTFTGAEAPSVVMIAGGVGITPLMSKIRYLADLSWGGEIFLIYSVRSPHDIIFRDELIYLQHRNRNLHVTITATRDDGSEWSGARGRITPKLLRDAVPNIAGQRVHICGPDVMATEIKTLLMHLGVPNERIHFESFTPPRQQATDSHPASRGEQPSKKQHDVTFSRSGKSWTAQAGQTVLEASEAAGVTIDFECRSGICGRCKVRLLDGRVAMETTDALTKADADDGLILSCQARCMTDIAVDA